jgi:hypothetical protein
MKTILLMILGLARIALAQSAAVADRQFFTLSAVSATAIAGDAYTTSWIRPNWLLQSRTGRPEPCSTEAGEPWLLGVHPTVGRIVGVSVAEFALTEALSYGLKRSRRRWLHEFWAVPAALRAEAHTQGMITNLRDCPQ